VRTHYFSSKPKVASKPKVIRVSLRGRVFTFITDSGVFSFGKLDRGTKLLIEVMEVEREDVVLDLGCGYGAIGIVAATLASKGLVYMVDINRRAVALAKKNAEINRVSNVVVLRGDCYEPVKNISFNVILTNPPVKAGMKVVRKMIEEAPNHLVSGGKLMLVIKTKYGWERIARIMGDSFGNTSIVEREAGYRVLKSVKN